MADNRMPVDLTCLTTLNPAPYKWIAKLTAQDNCGGIHRGTGFQISFPDVACTPVITSGSSIFKSGAYVESVRVELPGRQGVTVNKCDLFVHPEYEQCGNPEYDFGLILVPGKSTEGFGWSTILSDSDLHNRLITNCGYVNQNCEETLLIAGGYIYEHVGKTIKFMKDRPTAQAGSPVYTFYNDYDWTVIGVHADAANTAVRFTDEMIRSILTRMGALNVKAIESAQFRNVFIRCNGAGVTQPMPPGGGTVNCQYKPARSYEKFYLYPVDMPPDTVSEPQPRGKWVIRSARWDNVYLRLNSKGMCGFVGSGGGEVNCQFNAYSYERFYLRKLGANKYAFESVNFPKCCIRMDGNGVNCHTGPGGGTVNVQYYDECILGWEQFYLVPA